MLEELLTKGGMNFRVIHDGDLALPESQRYIGNKIIDGVQVDMTSGDAAKLDRAMIGNNQDWTMGSVYRSTGYVPQQLYLARSARFLNDVRTAPLKDDFQSLRGQGLKPGLIMDHKIEPIVEQYYRDVVYPRQGLLESEKDSINMLRSKFGLDSQRSMRSLPMQQQTAELAKKTLEIQIERTALYNGKIEPADLADEDMAEDVDSDATTILNSSNSAVTNQNQSTLPLYNNLNRRQRPIPVQPNVQPLPQPPGPPNNNNSLNGQPVQPPFQPPRRQQYPSNIQSNRQQQRIQNYNNGSMAYSALRDLFNDHQGINNNIDGIEDKKDEDDGDDNNPAVPANNTSILPVKPKANSNNNSALVQHLANSLNIGIQNNNDSIANQLQQDPQNSSSIIIAPQLDSSGSSSNNKGSGGNTDGSIKLSDNRQPVINSHRSFFDRLELDNQDSILGPQPGPGNPDGSNQSFSSFDPNGIEESKIDLNRNNNGSGSGVAQQVQVNNQNNMDSLFGKNAANISDLSSDIDYRIKFGSPSDEDMDHLRRRINPRNVSAYKSLLSHVDQVPIRSVEDYIKQDEEGSPRGKNVKQQLGRAAKSKYIDRLSRSIVRVKDIRDLLESGVQLSDPEVEYLDALMHQALGAYEYNVYRTQHTDVAQIINKQEKAFKDSIKRVEMAMDLMAMRNIGKKNGSLIDQRMVELEEAKLNNNDSMKKNNVEPEQPKTVPVQQNQFDSFQNNNQAVVPVIQNKFNEPSFDIQKIVKKQPIQQQQQQQQKDESEFKVPAPRQQQFDSFNVGKVEPKQQPAPVNNDSLEYIVQKKRQIPQEPVKQQYDSFQPYQYDGDSKISGLDFEKDLRAKDQPQPKQKWQQFDSFNMNMDDIPQPQPPKQQHMSVRKQQQQQQVFDSYRNASMEQPTPTPGGQDYENIINEQYTRDPEELERNLQIVEYDAREDGLSPLVIPTLVDGLRSDGRDSRLPYIQQAYHDIRQYITTSIFGQVRGNELLNGARLKPEEEDWIQRNYEYVEPNSERLGLMRNDYLNYAYSLNNYNTPQVQQMYTTDNNQIYGQSDTQQPHDALLDQTTPGNDMSMYSQNSIMQRQLNYQQQQQQLQQQQLQQQQQQQQQKAVNPPVQQPANKDAFGIATIPASREVDRVKQEQLQTYNQKQFEDILYNRQLEDERDRINMEIAKKYSNGPAKFKERQQQAFENMQKRQQEQARLQKEQSLLRQQQLEQQQKQLEESQLKRQQAAQQHAQSQALRQQRRDQRLEAERQMRDQMERDRAELMKKAPQKGINSIFDQAAKQPIQNQGISLYERGRQLRQQQQDQQQQIKPKFDFTGDRVNMQGVVQPYRRPVVQDRVPNHQQPVVNQQQLSYSAQDTTNRIQSLSRSRNSRDLVNRAQNTILQDEEAKISKGRSDSKSRAALERARNAILEEEEELPIDIGKINKAGQDSNMSANSIKTGIDDSVRYNKKKVKGKSRRKSIVQPKKGNGAGKTFSVLQRGMFSM